MKRSVAGILIADKKMLIAKRALKGQNGGLWEFPGGKVEHGETDREALVREFLEELSLPIEVKRRLGETSFVHNGESISLVGWLVASSEAPIIAEDHTAIEYVTVGQFMEYSVMESDLNLFYVIRSSLEELIGA